MPSLIPTNQAYPEILRHVVPQPDVLYYEGSLAALERPRLGVIGSRAMSPYGQAVTALLVAPLARAGLCIVSGLAYGIDAEAHRVARAANGTCIAVIGSGIDRLYPSRHTALARQVSETGLILSEYPPGTPGWKSNFPRRNRIIAALSPVLLIIEAADYSGTFSTARAALDLGQEVCVVPADITRVQSHGVHTLLKAGARPVTCPQDVINLYQLTIPLELEPERPALTGSASTLYDCISHGISKIDDLVRETGWGIATVQACLSTLELDGYITYRNRQWLKIS